VSIEEWSNLGVGEFAFGFGDGASEDLGGFDPFGDVWDSGRVGEIFKIEFEGFLEIGEGFLLSGTEAGHIVVEALGDLVDIFAVEGVVEVSHGSKNRGEVLDGKSGERKRSRCRVDSDQLA
jgi:hypothetical protein